MHHYLLMALLSVGTVFSLTGTVVLWRRRAGLKRQRAVPAVEQGSALFRKDPVTGAFEQVGSLAVEPAVWKGVSPAAKRVWILSLGTLAVFLSPLLFLQSADAALSETMRGIFSGALADFVNGIMEDTHNDVYIWTWMIFTTFSVIGLVTEIGKFIWGGYAKDSLVIFLFYWFATFIILGSYSAFTDAIWGIGVGISNAYQQHLVGNTDNFFLAQFVHKAMSAVVVDEIGIFDTGRLWFYYGQWMFVGAILDLVAWLASMWADFGYALAKVVGIVFVPFLLLPATRNLFDSWFRFLTGFVMLLIVLKATMVVCCITVKAVLGTLGVSFAGNGYGDPASVVNIAKDNMYVLGDTAAMLGVAILFVLSSFAFAGSLAAGVGNLSGGLGTAANMLVRKILK